MTKWEYEINIMPGSQVEDQDLLNDLGTDGWELVAFDFDSRTAIFKRPLSNGRCVCCFPVGDDD